LRRPHRSRILGRMKSTPSAILLALCALCATAGAANPPIALEIDARDTVQGIHHVHLTIPASTGPLTLAYPKWIPGEHAANGPITQVVSLEIKAGSATLPWRRDTLDAFSFHIDVPRGASTIDVRFDYLSPTTAFADGYGRTPNVTPHLLTMPFNHYVLYPRDASADAQPITASVRLPAGWKFDTALHPEHVGDTIHLPTVSLTTLIDSPLVAGEFFRTIPLTSGVAPTRVSIVADAPGDLAVSDTFTGALKRLPAEAQALFGPGHYREYVWLISLGNTLDPQNGLEHHESTDIRDSEDLFTNPVRMLEHRTTPHEFVHSWNGKYRRPVGLATRNYQEPMADDLLWVYEGTTRYLGDLLLRTRSGFVTQAQARDYLAWIVARLDVDRPGRAWRSLADTAVAIPAYSGAPGEWTPIRRQRDYYDEMMLVWLDADTLIREKTGGKHSFDDFCAGFYGGPERAPAVRPYSRKDVVGALNAVLPFDWNRFLATRVDAITPHAPLDGITRAGWKIVYDDSPNDFLAAREKVDGPDNLSLSLGLWVKADGSVTDVRHGSPAFAAGMVPGARVVAIGGHKWSADFARETLVKAEKSAEPIELVVENGDLIRVLHVDWHGGLRNPHLVRDESQPDRLSEILAPKVR
jgi:predicted metalloprotease with PDZ domain